MVATAMGFALSQLAFNIADHFLGAIFLLAEFTLLATGAEMSREKRVTINWKVRESEIANQ